MNSDTGHIKAFATEEDAIKEGYDLPLTTRQLAHVKPMSLKERKAWARKEMERRQKHRFKKRH